ncbi:MAG: hypothetical protein PVF76_12505 [Syntrophobacterales bacterium]|jgi:uncharacterized protein YlaN (UPF0358 family)
MADESGSNEFVSYEEALLSQVFTLDALVNVLERKGLINREEIVQEIKELHKKAAPST